MYSISTALYLETVEQLAETIGASNYFSGSLTFQFGEVACRMTTSVIVYRQHLSMPEDEQEIITDLIPVWWEFHTTIDGTEQLNDFSFTTLRKHI